MRKIWRPWHKAGITHIVGHASGVRRPAAGGTDGIQVLWNPTDDDFTPKSPEMLKRGVDFAVEALKDPEARLYVHCAAGVHRSAMMLLAVLCGMGWEIDAAMYEIESRRPVVDFADVYVESVRHFLEEYPEEARRSLERE